MDLSLNRLQHCTAEAQEKAVAFSFKPDIRQICEHTTTLFLHFKKVKSFPIKMLSRSV